MNIGEEKMLRFALCLLDQDGNVVAKTDGIKVSWAPDLEKEMSETFNITIKDELVDSIAEQIKINIQPDIISEYWRL